MIPVWATAKPAIPLANTVVLVRLLPILVLMPLLLAGLAPIQAGLVPDGVEPVLASEPLARGGIEIGETTRGEVAPKTIDGDPSDWIGTGTRLGGTTIYSHGEYIYQDFLFDDAGADDGRDAARLSTLAPVVAQEARLFRTESLAQALGVQFGAGAADPTGGVAVARQWYGDAQVPAGAQGAADLVEVRLAATGDSLQVLARFVAMTEQHDPAILVLVDTEDGFAERMVPYGAGLQTAAEWAFLVTPGGIKAHDLVAEHDVALVGAAVAVDRAGFTNAMEFTLPRAMLEKDGHVRLALASGLSSPAGLVPVSTGNGWSNLLNVAFRQEPVWLWNDQSQALALHDGNIDTMMQTLDLHRLEAGATEAWQPTAGYHERTMRSDPARSRETGQDGVWQPYGLYVPASWSPDATSPATFWLHWRGGTVHQAAAWTPRVFLELGEHLNAIVAVPHGRGTAGWYVGEAHRDFWEVFDDLHDWVAIDGSRRYLSGYSMGGYGTYLFSLLYPDRFAGGYSISGALTQGAWLGADDTGRDSVEADGDARRQLIFPLLENARNLGLVIHHGTDDELVPVSGIARVAERLMDLGYTHRTYLFPGYEHYTQAIADEWAEGARFLAQQVTPDSPGRVTYVRVPALEDAVSTIYAPAGPEPLDVGRAYWIEDMQPRQAEASDPSVLARADVISWALPQRGRLVPEVGAAALGHSTPFVMTGWATRSPHGAMHNEFDVDLENVARLRLDASGMGLDWARRIEGEVKTDGPVRLELVGSPPSPKVRLDGMATAASVEGDVLVLQLPAGAHAITVKP